eukprot:CAMPEP_0115052600 /NCGR_PEP_ID=MMETSP0227-20121206/3033_1 /TAXON_ID=89957 /ORGANISM="Polarella glacialis, Strain CCMP 1383" /LENGTH=40 /DNA_ID= /DNA_START= /DNA_END= /DNA_ORIENTATION=
MAEACGGSTAAIAHAPIRRVPAIGTSVISSSGVVRAAARE